MMIGSMRHGITATCAGAMARLFRFLKSDVGSA